MIAGQAIMKKIEPGRQPYPCAASKLAPKMSPAPASLARTPGNAKVHHLFEDNCTMNFLQPGMEVSVFRCQEREKQEPKLDTSPLTPETSYFGLHL
jgi:hypothetical protein